MKVSTNVKPKKKGDDPFKKAASNVGNIFKKSEVKAKEKESADVEAAKKYDENLKAAAKKHSPVKTGRVTSGDVAASGAYKGTQPGNYSESQRVKGLKQTGYYNAKPAVVGGTKKMVRISKKNVSKSGASKQAKKAAKKLY